MGYVSQSIGPFWAICSACNTLNVEYKMQHIATGKKLNIAPSKCRSRGGHRGPEYILSTLYNGRRVGWMHKKEWRQGVVRNRWTKDDGGKCIGGVEVEASDGTTTQHKYPGLVTSLKPLPKAFEFDEVATKVVPACQTQDEFDTMVAEASRTVTAEGFMAIVVENFEAPKGEKLLKKVEPMHFERLYEVNTLDDDDDQVPTAERATTTAFLTFKRLKENLLSGQTSLGSDRLSPYDMVKKATGARLGLYTENINFKPFKTRGRLRPTSFSDETPYVAEIRKDGHVGKWVLKRRPLGATADSGGSERMATLSATNWVYSTARERARCIEAMSQLPGVTMGSPLLAEEGAGTVVHQEQACLGSVNVLFKGFKLWFYGDGLRLWRDAKGGHLDGLAKDKLVYPTPEECEQYGIHVYLQAEGTVVLIASGVMHTVMSVTTTYAEASNIIYDETVWIKILLREVDLLLPSCYPEERLTELRARKGPSLPEGVALYSEVKVAINNKAKHDVERLAKWCKHTHDFLRVQALRVPTPLKFQHYAVGDIVDVGAIEEEDGKASSAVYAVKTTMEDLTYVLACRRGDSKRRFPEDAVLRFNLEYRCSIPTLLEPQRIAVKVGEGAEVGEVEGAGEGEGVGMGEGGGRKLEGVNAMMVIVQVVKGEVRDEWGLPRGVYAKTAVGKSLKRPSTSKPRFKVRTPACYTTVDT